MANDVVFDYDAIDTTASTMGNKLADIAAELTTLKDTVASLLQNGLVFEKASPAMTDAYNQFTSQLDASAKNIDEYAKMFQNFATEMANSDEQITNDVNAAAAEAANNNEE
ncbi:hypothetical protein H7827_15450 [Streptomyces sp. JH002]|uniref:Cell division-related protein n=1 Tax=Streptomyces xiamenensis TaxID=408015 RepID=A0A0F7CP29_9ACTN|nr:MULTISPECIES: hypothetical protein [Streptomyces]AKG43941.1 cell division-related protein [Streptomyces xiamenensis]MCU4747970.1 hypothetical protein [Streptomyces sp. G-5]QQN78582.1 hypothetical protein IPZ77_14865 [Streptomyces sp. XC 2026]